MYTLEPLTFSSNSLEPYLDAKTVEIHYGKHHANYLSKTNALLEANHYQAEYSLSELVNHLDLFPSEVRETLLFNIGGVLNHNLYWKTISPNQKNVPVDQIKMAIDLKYGSFDLFKEEFMKHANSMMGSGWVFLVINSNHELEIIKTKNQETPYTNHLIPIMALDLWEHAYYLKYQNLRTDYINNFFNIIDFDNINKLYEENI